MPALGQTVLYELDSADVAEITTRRAQALAAAAASPVPVPASGGRPVAAGDLYPAIIVRIRPLDPDAGASLRVLLDGTDLLWAEARPEGVGPGTWRLPGL